MIYYDAYRHADVERPKMTWTKIHKWAGLALFGLACFGAGNVISTGYFQIPSLWQKANTLQHVESHDIPKLKALIPKGAPSKTESATTEPANCIPHPEPKPSP